MNQIEPAVEFRNVSKKFGAVKVFDSVNITIGQGEFVVFVGPSGSGKSTLLRMIAGLENVTDGDVLIGGRDVTFAEPSDRGIAMVFQSYALYPHMNVYDNIAFNLRLGRRSRAEIDQRVRQAVKVLRLEELLQRSPAQLSGGQRQRVAIGRAIVRDPKVFLFDEPLSNLDAALRVQMRLEIARLHKELGTTMIYVTHDQVEAMTLADRIVVLDNCEIQQVGTPLELYEHPRNRFVASFIGSPTMNLLDAIVVSSGETGRGVQIGGSSYPIGLTDMEVGAPLTIGARPEVMSIHPEGTALSPALIALSAIVTSVERLGNINYAYFELSDGQHVTVQTLGVTDLVAGQRVTLGLPQDACHFFDQSGVALLQNATNKALSA